MEMKQKSPMILLDPTNEHRPPVRERVRRLRSLESVRVALLDISKPRGEIFLNRIEERLRERGAEVQRFSKPTFTKPAPVDLRHDIASRCGAVIEALAD